MSFIATLSLLPPLMVVIMIVLIRIMPVMMISDQIWTLITSICNERVTFSRERMLCNEDNKRKSVIINAFTGTGELFRSEIGLPTEKIETSEGEEVGCEGVCLIDQNIYVFSSISSAPWTK